MPSNGLHYQGDSKKKTSDILKYNCFAVFEETIRFQSLLAQKKLAGNILLVFYFLLEENPYQFFGVMSRRSLDIMVHKYTEKKEKCRI